MFTNKNHETYLGNKGYTILKKKLTLEEQTFIRSELLAKPHVMGSPVNNGNTFPVYRESSNKFYVPRYFGEEHFGKPKEYKIGNIGFTFGIFIISIASYIFGFLI